MIALTVPPAGVAASGGQGPVLPGCSRSVALQHQSKAFGNSSRQDRTAAWVLRPPLSGGRGSGRSAASAAPPAASATAAAATAAAAAVDVTFFPAAVWVKFAAAVIGVYAAYWLGLARFMPRGQPVANFLDKEQQPLGFRLIVAAVIAVLGSTYLLPLAGMAASGAWRAGLTYSLPVMVQLAINIAIETLSRRKGRVLAVYASTVANTMCRVVLALAALYDMSRLAAAPHWALWFASAAQAAANAAVALLIVPVAMSNLDVVTVEPLAEPGAKA